MRQLTDANGAVTLTQSFAPYGEPLNTASSAESVYGFAGEETDESGLIHLRARYYDPALKRFISKDTYGGSFAAPPTLNRWAYAGGNPIRYTDPSGHCWGFASGLRDVPTYDTTCNNLDMAYTILYHPNSQLWQRGVAGWYIAAEFAHHAFTAIGAPVFGCIAACPTVGAAATRLVVPAISLYYWLTRFAQTPVGQIAGNAAEGALEGCLEQCTPGNVAANAVAEVVFDELATGGMNLRGLRFTPDEVRLLGPEAGGGFIERPGYMGPEEGWSNQRRESDIARGILPSQVAPTLQEEIASGRHVVMDELIGNGGIVYKSDYMFAIDESGNIRVGRLSTGYGYHSQLVNGANVFGAGHIEFDAAGDIVSVAPFSGHYFRPYWDKQYYGYLQHLLQHSGFDTSTINFIRPVE